MLPLLRKQSIF